MSLIKRLESASGPDRELDREIYEATGHCAHRETEWHWSDGHSHEKTFVCKTCGKAVYGDSHIPAFTANVQVVIDMLVPEGMSWEVRASAVGDKGQARIWDYMRQPGFKGGSLPGGGDIVVTGCATPALALVIAAIQARGME